MQTLAVDFEAYGAVFRAEENGCVLLKMFFTRKESFMGYHGSAR